MLIYLTLLLVTVLIHLLSAVSLRDSLLLGFAFITEHSS